MVTAMTAASGVGKGRSGAGSGRRPKLSTAVRNDRPPTVRYSGPKPYLASRKKPAGGPMTQDAENTDRTAR